MLPENINRQQYKKWLQSIYDEIDRQRLQAMMKLNAATLQHYWWLGNHILNKQTTFGWGAKVIDVLSKDLQKHYGEDSGYSVRNLKYMRTFAAEYPGFPIVQVPLAQLRGTPNLMLLLGKYPISADGEFVQVPLAQITWYHHISLMPKIKDNVLRAFYIAASAANGWSRDVMLMQIEDKYHEKFAALPNNFDLTLPPVNSDLAKATFKDPYNFGFVDMSQVHRERDIEDQLTTRISDFLLELGKGFAFVGRQYSINIAGEECKIDLLMYHTQLHCYVVVELKAVDFMPEFVSKLNYYISAVDDLVKSPQDNPTIGLLLCRSKNKTKVEYALRGMSQPLGVAEYLTTKLMEELESTLPSINDLENTLNEPVTEFRAN